MIINFKNITTFRKACDALNINYNTVSIIINRMIKFSKASVAMFKLNIIRKALNLGQDLHLTKGPKDSYIYYPFNPFVAKSSTSFDNKLNSGEMEVIGKIKSEGECYKVLSSSKAYFGGYAGLGSFYSVNGISTADVGLGFLGCANEEIALHFSKYFSMLITEAKYGDIVDFEIIESKY